MCKYLIICILLTLNIAWAFDEGEFLSHQEFVELILYGDQKILTDDEKTIQRKIIDELLDNSEIEEIFPISLREIRRNHHKRILSLQEKLLGITQIMLNDEFGLKEKYILESMGDRMIDLIPSGTNQPSLAKIGYLTNQKIVDNLRKKSFKLSENLQLLSPEKRTDMIINFPFSSFTDQELLQLFSSNADSIESFFFAKLINQLRPEGKEVLLNEAKKKMFLFNYEQLRDWLSELTPENDVWGNQGENVKAFEKYYQKLKQKDFDTKSLSSEKLWRQFFNLFHPILSEVAIEDLTQLKTEFKKRFASFKASTIKTDRLELLFQNFLNDSFQRNGSFNSIPFSIHYYVKGHLSENKYLTLEDLGEIISSRNKFSTSDLVEIFKKIVPANGDLDHLTDQAIVNILESIVKHEQTMPSIDFSKLKRMVEEERSAFRNRIREMLDSSPYEEELRKIFKTNRGLISSILMPNKSINDLLFRIKDAALSFKKFNQVIDNNLENDLLKLGSIDQSYLKDQLLKIFSPEELINFYEYLKGKMLTKNLKFFKSLSPAIESIELEISRRLIDFSPQQRIRFIQMYDSPKTYLNDANIIIRNSTSEFFVTNTQNKFNHFDKEVVLNIMQKEKIIPKRVLRKNIGKDEWSKIFKMAIEIINSPAGLTEIDQLENKKRFKRLISIRTDPSQLLMLLASIERNNLKDVLTGFKYSDLGLVIFLENFKEIKNSLFDESIDLSMKYKKEFIDLIQTNMDRIEENMETMVNLISDEKLRITTLSGSITDRNRKPVQLSHQQVFEIFEEKKIFLHYNESENTLKYLAKRNFSLTLELIQRCFDPSRSN